MRVGSLFSGIGGLDLGLERAGMEIVWQVEIDDYCNRVLEKHWPDVKRYRDVREFPPAEGCADVDLICGGFPCQDISDAGKRIGIEGDQSGLWREFARIIRMVRPQYILVENVPALLRRGMGIVLRDLAESGFHAAWQSISGAEFGTHFVGERLFIIAQDASTGGLRWTRRWRPNSAREKCWGKLQFERLL